MESWGPFSKNRCGLAKERATEERSDGCGHWQGDGGRQSVRLDRIGCQRPGGTVSQKTALSRSSDGSHTHFLCQRSGLVGSCVPKHLSCPERFRALRTGNIHQDSEMGELILEPFRFFLRKTESDERSGIPAKGRSFTRHHESMKERLRPDEETYSRNQHRAEFGKPANQAGGDSAGLSFGIKQARIPDN